MKYHIEGLFKEAISDYIDEKFDKSISRLQEVLNADPNHRLAGLTLGSAWLKLGKADRAREQFNALIESDPRYARAYHLRGLAHQHLRDSDAALKDFSSAIYLDGEYGAAYHSRATLFGELGAADKAAEDIEMITRLTERNLESFSNDNNILRSHQLYMEAALGSEFDHLVGSA